ncbi:MAG TPA: RDD family protein [Bryobacteraceae bacterium]
MPIPTLTPLRPSVREAPGRRVAPRHRPSVPRPRTNPDAQQTFDLQEEPSTGIGGHSAGMVLQPGSAMHRELNLADVPVALPTHRMLAAAVDLSIVIVSLGLFLGVYSILTILVSGTSDIVIDRQTLPFLGGATLVFSMFYRILWCLANGDTPGMRFAGLRLVDFDGRSPDREERFVRQIASILSLAAAGLGLVWALVDEESLTWHDHISKTFPTPA